MAKLPLPEIGPTLEKYLDCIKTFVDEETHRRNRSLVDDFLSKDDLLAKVDSHLKLRAETKDNWAYRWWLEDMYLDNMLPLPVNSNPGWVFPRRDFLGNQDNLIKYVCGIIQGLVQFKKQLESGTFETETVKSRVTGTQSLCMEQYNRLLNAYRMPGGKGQDELESTDPSLSRQEESAVVMYKGHMFKLRLKTNGTWHDERRIYLGLEKIMEQDEEAPIQMRAQVLTTTGRNEWHLNREKLDKLGNGETLIAFETCLFVVCLDEEPQNLSDKERSHKDMFRQMLTGNGVHLNGTNRWFDKTINVVCSLDGVSGICYEHTAAEGVAVVNMLTKVLNNISPQLNDEMVNASERKEDGIREDVKDLEWVLDNEMEKAIMLALEAFDKLDRDTDIEICLFNNFGKDFIKSCNCSPDAFLQMALQLTYYKLHSKLCSTYESASLRRFKSGRVDSIRASHPEALAWVDLMTKEDISKEAKLAALKHAISKQTQVTLDNITGKGVDIPMLGIRRCMQDLLSKGEISEEDTKLFQDPAFDKSLKFKLSTSQVAIGLPQSYMGYGAVVPDGYGVSYNLQNDHVIFCIASFHSCQETSSVNFARKVTQAMMEMQDLFVKNEE